MRLSAEKGRLDRSLNTAEQELQESLRQVGVLQVRTCWGGQTLGDTMGTGTETWSSAKTLQNFTDRWRQSRGTRGRNRNG